MAEIKVQSEKDSLDAIEARCEAANLECEVHRDDDDSGVDEPFAVLALKAGRKSRWLGIDEEEAKKLLALPFEHYSFLDRYDAFASFNEGVIEAALESASGGPAGPRRFAGVGPQDELPNPIMAVEGSSGERISIGRPSDAAEIMLGAEKMTLRIEGLEISQHDQAYRTLEILANAILFELDGRRRSSLALRRRRNFSRAGAVRAQAPLPESFPASEFDPEPMSLYWYARSAVRMPLLRFLAYYQILEFYFDQHSQAEARQRVANILKDPAFSPHRDRDITRVLTASHRGGQRYGDERAQFKSTVRACADPNLMREYLFEKRNKKFFERKTDGLTDTVVRSTMTDNELLDETAQRLYDIRCKIVHTKESGGGEELSLLLPFSPEAEKLGRDTDLIHMIARGALINGSRPLEVPGPATTEVRATPDESPAAAPRSPPR